MAEARPERLKLRDMELGVKKGQVRGKREFPDKWWCGSCFDLEWAIVLLVELEARPSAAKVLPIQPDFVPNLVGRGVLDGMVEELRVLGVGNLEGSTDLFMDSLQVVVSLLSCR
jgi:hypothetical protein